MKPSEESLNTEPVSATVVSPGARLAQARTQRGMSADQVSRETNLSPRYVQALEADDYDALPGAAFIRGYIRRYAQLVQLPADELVADFDSVWRSRAPVVAVAEARPATRGPVKVSGLGQASRELLGQGAARISVASILSWGSLALLILLLLGTLFWNGNSDGTDIDVNDPVALDIDTAVEAPVEPATVPAPVEPAQPAVTAPVDGSAPAVDAPVQPGAAPTATQPSAQPAALAPATVQPTPSASAQPTPVAAATAPAVAPVAPAPARPQQPAAGATVIPASPAAASARPVAPATTVPVISRPLTPGSQPAAAKPATTTVPVTTLPAQPARLASAPAPATVVPVSPAPVAATEPRIDSLSFNFAGKSWISVRDATGQELVYGLKNPGQTVTVTGQAPFSINIGNVNVTTMSRNGKPVNLKPYTRGEIASFRLTR